MKHWPASPMLVNPISVDDLIETLRGTREFALIDPREEGDFTRGHLMAASNTPFSRLELLIGQAVPHHDTPIVLVDDDTGPVERAAHLLSRMGYTDLSVLAGGIAAWHGCGYPQFTGVNVPGKAFGEWVEYHLCPPAMSAETLKAHLDADDPVLLIDTRTPEEHTDYCIPGALLCPNGELSIRALALIADRNMTVVAHCAGRTRSIIGAQTMIDLGVTLPVYALENGTVGWEAIGAELERGASRPLPETDGGRIAGRAATQELSRQADIQTIDLSTLGDMQAQTDRTTVLVDVRPREDYNVGHVPGAHHVPGGQMIQNVDKAVIVKNARVVLTDDDGTRSTLVAFWLKRMGFSDVYVLTTEAADRTDRVEEPATGAEPMTTINHITDDDLIVDCRFSLAYRRGHIPGSWHLSRANLDRDLPRLPVTTGAVFIVADDEAYAQLLARDLAHAGYIPNPKIIIGGYGQWAIAGRDIETGYTHLASPPSDMWYDGEHMENSDDALRENRRYIDWEKALIDDLPDEPSIRYV